MSMTATIPAPTLSDYEIERGKPMPDKNHALIQSRLNYCLMREKGEDYTFMTEVHVEMPVKDRVPDISIYPILDFDPDDNEIKMAAPPLGAIEILSEMQSLQELTKKRKIYFDKGVLSYWIVLPSLRTIYVYNAFDSFLSFNHHQILKDKVLGIELNLAEIFPKNLKILRGGKSVF